MQPFQDLLHYSIEFEVSRSESEHLKDWVSGKTKDETILTKDQEKKGSTKEEELLTL